MSCIKFFSIPTSKSMKFKYTSAFAGIIASSVLAIATTPAQAFNFTSGTNLGSCSTLLTASCKTDDGFTLKAGGSRDKKDVLEAKTINGVTGVGVSNGGNDVVTAEINHGEYIDLSLEAPKSLKSLDFSFLYPRNGIFNDLVYEVAAVAPNLANVFGTLTLRDNNSAVWSWDGKGQTVNSSNPGGGLYSVLNPFGDTLISQLRLTAPSQPGVDEYSAQNNDYALAGAEVKDVPEPATIAGLGLVAGALVTSRRRRKARA